MAHVSPSFSATLRLSLEDAPGTFARVAEAIGEAGGSLGAIDLVRVDAGTKIRDVTVMATDEAHLHEIAEAARSVEGVDGLIRLCSHGGPRVTASLSMFSHQASR